MRDGEAFCAKCRKAIIPISSRTVRFEPGMNALQGTCPNCGKKVTRFLKG